MPILPEDIRLFASERLTDFNDGGGRMSPNVIVDGEDNNLFDDVTDFDRLTGRVSMRKLFAQLLNEDTDAGLSAYLFLDTAPSDAATDACIFKTGGLSTERSGAQAALEQTWKVPVAPSHAVYSSSGPTVVVSVASSGGFPTGLDIGDGVALLEDNAPPAAAFATVLGFGGSFGLSGPGGIGIFYYREVVLDRVVPTIIGAGGDAPHRLYYGVSVVDAVKAYGCAGIDAALEDDTELTVSSAVCRVVPWDGVADYPAEAEGIDPGPFEIFDGSVPVFRNGDPCLVHHTDSTAPAAASNGGTVDVGRENLARAEVVGADGTVHARFDRNAPAPTGVGCSADLDTGIVSFSDVSGFSQPVTIRHRIEELVAISNVVGLAVTLNRGLSRVYPSGSKISSLLRLGDLQGRVENGFAQSNWTGAWSDTVIGGTPLADFNDTDHPIVTVNAGAVEDRWAVIFTNTTQFRVISEAGGEITGGNVGADYAPINPATGVPYFTIPSAGWGLGWAAGNVWRFNTKGANAPTWALRCTAPSLPGGDDKVVVEFRTYVNA